MRQSLLSCIQKMRHATIEHAQEAAAQLRRKLERQGERGRMVNVYYCAFCRGYHIGTEERKKTRR